MDEKYFKKDGEVFVEEVSSDDNMGGRSVRNSKYDVFEKKEVKKSNEREAVEDAL